MKYVEILMIKNKNVAGAETFLFFVFTTNGRYMQVEGSETKKMVSTFFFHCQPKKC